MTGPAYKPSRPEKVEKIYADLIKEGKVRIVRRKGRPPLIVWIEDQKS